MEKEFPFRITTSMTLRRGDEILKRVNLYVSLQQPASPYPT